MKKKYITYHPLKFKPLNFCSIVAALFFLSSCFLWSNCLVYARYDLSCDQSSTFQAINAKDFDAFAVYARYVSMYMLV